MCAQHITYDEKAGEIHIGGGKERYIIIPMRAFAAIIDAVVNVVGVGAACGLLYYLGKRIGRGLVEELAHRMQGHAKTPEEMAKAYAGYLEELGFGKIEVREVTDNSATIYMAEAPSIAGVRIVKGKAEEMLAREKICYLEAGMMAAAFEGYLGGRWVGTELEHGTEDNPYCVIKVQKQA